jgi:hypothetical protein
MKGLRFFSVVAVALSVAAVTLAVVVLAVSPAEAQPPFSGLPPRLIAAGTVHGNATFAKSWKMTSGIMTCSWNTSNKWYEITIPGVHYELDNFATLITACDGGSSNPVPVAGAVYDCVGGKLLISPIDPNGKRVQGRFSFVVFQYPTPIK